MHIGHSLYIDYKLVYGYTTLISQWRSLVVSRVNIYTYRRMRSSYLYLYAHECVGIVAGDMLSIDLRGTSAYSAYSLESNPVAHAH